MKTAHILQHVSFENIGSIAEWLETRGISYRYTRFYEAQHTLPPLSTFDALIIMGGPMGVHDESFYPWLIEEKRFIKQAMDAGKVVIGICLGAQLMADALGAVVVPHTQKEIGWFSIEWTDAVMRHKIGHKLQKRQMAFHWHGDSFAIPAGAVHLAKSEACANQGFLWNDRALGLQFHLEITEYGVSQLIAHCGHELVVDAPYVTAGNAIQARGEYFTEMKNTLHRLLDFFLPEI